jgi:hypothetical protein
MRRDEMRAVLEKVELAATTDNAKPLPRWTIWQWIKSCFRWKL